MRAERRADHDGDRPGARHLFARPPRVEATSSGRETGITAGEQLRR
jgi:hypothetical protein